MKLHLTMDLFKERKGSYRYQPENKEEYIHSLYVRKEALGKGEKPPSSIVLTVSGLQD